MHKCQYDNLIVEDDMFKFKDSHGVWIKHRVNYCPICGWSKTMADLMKDQDKRDGI